MVTGTTRSVNQRCPSGWGTALFVLCLLPAGAEAQRLDRDADAAPRRGGVDQEFSLPPTLEGCALPLPGGRDRDSGLSDLYIANNQGATALLAPSLRGRGVYTDNVTLAPPGEEESDWVTQIIPAVSYCRISSRLRAQVNYVGHVNFYANDSDRNDIYHNIDANSTAVLVPDNFFLDTGVGYGQATIDSRGAFSDDLALDTGNRTDALRVNVSPYYQQDLGRIGRSSARYRYSSVEYDEGVPDIERHSGSFTLVNPSEADTWSYVASYRTERVERDNREDPDWFDNAYLELGYLMTPRLRLLARGGAETDYLEDGTQDRLGSTYWDAGFRWSDARTTLEARYGQRFFGDSYVFRFSRRASRLTASIQYNESPEVTDRLSFADPEDLGLPGQIFDPRIGEFIDTPRLTLSENEVYVRRRTTGALSYETARSEVNLAVFNEEREYIVTGNNEDRFGVDAYWRWQWLPRTSLIPRVTWERIDFRDGQSDTIRGAQISAARLLSPKMQAGVTLRRQERSSNVAAAEYEENALILEITRLF